MGCNSRPLILSPILKRFFPLCNMIMQNKPSGWDLENTGAILALLQSVSDVICIIPVLLLLCVLKQSLAREFFSPPSALESREVKHWEHFECKQCVQWMLSYTKTSGGLSVEQMLSNVISNLQSQYPTLHHATTIVLPLST